jgi:putative transposase
MGVRPSMGSVGDAYDNLMAQSFFATLERELLERRRFKNQAEVQLAVFEGWYKARFSEPGDVPFPVERGG